MIRLEDVSTRDYIMKNKIAYNARCLYVYKILVDYKITDYQMLKDFLESETPNELIKQNPNYFWGIHELKIQLSCIEYKLEKMNNRNKQIELFSFDSLKSLEIDDKVLNITDERNKGKILLCSNPLSLSRGINSIRKLSISEIKFLLNHIDSNSFKNSLLNLDRITPKKLETIVKAIRFYDEQVLRQYFETSDRDTNLFFLNQKEKRELVKEDILDIAEYITDNADECIWGNLSETTKKRMLAASISNRDGDIKRAKESLIDTISRYTTLTELETGIFNEQEVVTVIGGTIKRQLKRPIDRFITK